MYGLPDKTLQSLFFFSLPLDELHACQTAPALMNGGGERKTEERREKAREREIKRV